MHNQQGFLKVVNEIAQSEAGKVRGYLKSDDEINLFDAVLGNLLDCNNKLRINNFAYAAREFIRIYIDNRCTDTQIKKCIWFDKNKNHGNVTRSDKMRYVIHKSLPIEYVKDELEIDSEICIKEMIESIDTLSKYAHISGTFESSNEDSQIAKNALNAFWGILSTIDETKDKITENLIDAVSSLIDNDFMINYCDQIDSLSTHTSIEDVEHYIDSIEIQDDCAVIYVDGAIELQLQWGSNSDLLSWRWSYRKSLSKI